jgi:hypothetical protein
MENINIMTDKEVHRKFNRPNLSNDLCGQDAVDYDVFLETKRKELLTRVKINTYSLLKKEN